MEISFLLTAFLVVVAAVILTWILVKSKFNASISVISTKLEAATKAHELSIEQLKIITESERELSINLQETEKAKAVLESEYGLLTAANADFRATTTTLGEKLQNLQSELQTASQLKVKAETVYDNASAQISDLENKEGKLKVEITQLQKLLSDTKQDNAVLEAKHEETSKRLEEQQQFINQANEKLKEAFSSLSSDALKKNNESFVTLAKATLETQVTDAKGDLEKKQQAIDALVKPLSLSLEKFDTKIQDLEKIRLEQHGQINQYMQGVQTTTEKLQQETHSLVTALKKSHGRGRYGEIALRRVVEFAGMTAHCDFQEQVTVETEEGNLRPDLNIHLPGQKTIVVDSKVPLIAYMKVFETENEEEKKQFLIQHAAAVRGHLKKLANKAYWSQFKESPDYVVLYMQIESSFGAALETDPTLIEDGIREKVVFATPTTLITLLRTVGFVWQQVSITDNIEQIRDAGIELYNRTTTLLDHFDTVGSNLKTAVNNYNKAVSSLESRFIPSAKKLYNLGSAYTKSIVPEMQQIELNVRELVASPPPSNTSDDNDENTPGE